MKHFEVSAVVCHHNGTFDAEIAFKEEEYTREGSERTTVQKLIQAGFSSREAAKSRASDEVKHVEDIIRDHAIAYLSRYRDAQA